MATSDYSSTPQTTNAARVSRVVMGPCSDLLRDVLRYYIPDTDFPTKLISFKTTVKPLIKGPQRDILYPRNAVCTATYDDFDISLLYLLIRNMCGIAAHAQGWGNPPSPTERTLSANLDRIREIRNKYCGHSPLISLSNAEFTQIWSELRQIVQEIEYKISGPSTKFTNEIDFLRTETMDPEQEIQYLDLIDKQKEELENVQGEQLKLLQQQTEHGETLQNHGAQMQAIESNMSRGFQKIEDQQQKQREIQLNQEMKLQQLQIDSEATNIIVNTANVLKGHVSSKTYTETSVIQSALERLQTHHVLILTGKGGEGKTTASFQIMHKLANHTPVILEHPTQWDKVVNSSKNMVILLDDVVGRTNLDRSKMEIWRNKFQNIISCVKHGNIYVIIGIRQDILKEVREIHPEDDIFKEDYEINLSSCEYKFTVEEKRMIIDKYMMNYQYKAKDLQGEDFDEEVGFHGEEKIYELPFIVQTKIIESDPYFGFGRTCHLFFAKKEFYELGLGFFKRPNEIMMKDIEKMRKSTNHLEQVEYCVLAYVFLYQNIDINNFYEDNVEFLDISKKTRISVFTNQDIIDAVQELEGPYLSSTSNGCIYTFSHETVIEAVLLSFGQLAPDTVIQNCSRSTLNELIRTEKYKKRPGEIVLKIQKRSYPALLDKLLTVNTHYSYKDIDNESSKAFLHMGKILVSKNKEFDALGLRFHPAFNDPDFAATVFSFHAGPTRVKMYSAIFYSMFFFYSSELIKSVMKFRREDAEGCCCDLGESDCECNCHHVTTESDTHQCCNVCQFIIRDTDIYHLIEYCEVTYYHFSTKENILTLCQCINGFRNASYIYDFVFDYSWLFFTVTGTLFSLCFDNDWDEIIDLILEVHTPSENVICKLVYHSSEDSLIKLCQIINKSNDPDKYYRHSVVCQEDNERKDVDTGLIMLQHCVIRGYDNVVNYILASQKPSKTDRMWSCAHLAAFAGRLSMLQRFVNMGHSLNERTIEGYSVLQCALLGLRYGNCKRITKRFGDVDDTYMLHFIPLADAKQYENMLTYILSKEPDLTFDFDFPLDTYGNNIIHYLVINDRESILDLLWTMKKEIFYRRANTELPTALHVAAYLGRHHLVKKLWTFGVRPIRDDPSLMITTWSGFCFHGLEIATPDPSSLYLYTEETYETKDFSSLNVCLHFGSDNYFRATDKVLNEIKSTAEINEQKFFSYEFAANEMRQLS